MLLLKKEVIPERFVLLHNVLTAKIQQMDFTQGKIKEADIEQLSSVKGMNKTSAKAIFDYFRDTGATVLVYRFPNLFGKWCRPNYNSAVATFCNNIANDLPIQVNDRSVQLELLYIDDLINEMLLALEGSGKIRSLSPASICS